MNEDEAQRLLTLIRKLVDKSMFYLRMTVGTDESDYARRQELAGCSKGDLVARAIEVEFPETFDPDWEIR